MALRRDKGRSFGDSQLDIRDELLRYSKLNGYVAGQFADAVCSCGATQFQLLIDEQEGVAARVCSVCGGEHLMGDSADFVDEAELESCECTCGGDLFEITIGVSLYASSEDVRWLYVGCRCPNCSLAGCYGDWKSEFVGYRALLANV